MRQPVSYEWLPCSGLCRLWKRTSRWDHLCVHVSCDLLVSDAFSIIRLSMRFCTFGVLAWLLMFRLRSIPFRTSISIFLVIVSHTSFANAERYRGVFSINSHFLLTLWWAFASAFLFVANCFWLAFLFIEFLLLFVACFIVRRFCCTPPTICSVNSEVVSKFDAAKVTRF